MPFEYGTLDGVYLYVADNWVCVNSGAGCRCFQSHLMSRSKVMAAMQWLPVLFKLP